MWTCSDVAVVGACRASQIYSRGPGFRCTYADFEQFWFRAGALQPLAVMEGPVAASFAMRSLQAWPWRCRWPFRCAEHATIAVCAGRAHRGIFDSAARRGPSERLNDNGVGLRKPDLRAKKLRRCFSEGPHTQVPGTHGYPHRRCGCRVGGTGESGPAVSKICITTVSSPTLLRASHQPGWKAWPTRNCTV